MLVIADIIKHENKILLFQAFPINRPKIFKEDLIISSNLDKLILILISL